MTGPFGGLSGITIIDDGASAADAASVRLPVAPADGTSAGRPPVEARVVIVGSGPAGLTAAIYAARANLEPVVLAGYVPGGQLMITSDVENYPGFPDGIQGPELMALFREQAVRFGSRIVDVDVDRVDLSSRPFRLWAAGVEYRAEAVIVASGASALWLGLDSETRLRGKGVSACATCDGFFFKGKKVAVVGGGDTALEEATFLTRFAREVVLIHRRGDLRGSKIMRDRVLAHPQITVRWHTAIEAVEGDQVVSGLRLRDMRTGETTEEPVDGLFVAIGYQPNTTVFRDWLESDEHGYLVVRGETGSHIEGVFIAGDVHDHRYRQAVTAAGDGCRAAIDAERWLEAIEGAPATTSAASAASATSVG